MYKKLILLSCLLFSTDAIAKKEALLIGNSDYQYITDLENPKSSIEKLKKALKKLDFHVTTAYNLNGENLSAEVEKFRLR
jgi:uncharacterized caspase-like protein